jgi:alanine racemase
MRSISSWKINLTKFRDNIKKVQDITKSKLMIMLKAQAYGHGLFEMVESLDIYKQDEISIGVASLQEAIAIRKICPQCQLDIYVFSEILIQEEKFHEYYLDFNITPIISSLKDLKDLLSYKELSSLPIYLKFNTGMNRLGIEFNELEDIFQLLKINQRKQVQHVMSHFACSYIKGHTLTEKQCEKFEKILKAFDQNNIEVKEQSIANSGAIEQGIGYQYTHVRPGLKTFGVIV